MADRIVKVVLRGEISSFVGSMRASSSAVKATVASMTEASREAQAFRGHLTDVGTTAGRIGLVAAGGLALIAKSAADFEQSMANVAATGDDARGSLDALKQAALDAGARTRYSATEAAGAIENLAKAGLSAAEILDGGLDGALDLAAAGGLDVAKAAEIAAISLKQFGLDGDQASHVADLLAAGAGKAVGDVTDLGAALAQSGLVANQTGLSIEETTAALSAMASAGLLGSDAGTALKSTLQRLTPQSKEAEKLMASLGISAYDAQGNFIGLANFAGNLQGALQDLTPEQRNSALATIFGSDAVRAASVLYSEGADGIRKWEAATNDAGYASEVASIRMDTLKGDLETLGGALQTAFITSGEGANGPLREMVQLLTSLVDGYNSLPGPLKTAATGGLALTAAIGGTVFAVSRAISGYAGFKENVAGLGIEFDKANKKALALRAGAAAAGVGLAALSGPARDANETLGDFTDVAAAAALGFAAGGPWGAAIGGGIALFSALGSSSADAAVDMQGLTATLDAQTGAVTTNTAAWVSKQLADSGVADALDIAGVSLATATDAVLGNKDAMVAVTEAAEGYGFAAGAILDPINQMRDGIIAEKDAKLASNEATAGSVEAQAAAAAGFGEMGTEAESAADQVKALSEALDALLDPFLAQEDASNAWKDSLAGLTQKIRENGATLDDNSSKGRANQDAIRDTVKSLKDAAQAEFEVTGNADQMAAKLQRGAEKILAAGRAAGISEKEMRGYLKQLGLTPEQIRTLIKADTADAMNKVRSLQRFIDGMNGKTVKVNVIGGTPGGITENAEGGYISGPGTGTSDSIPAYLSNGEYVIRAASVAKYGTKMFESLNAGRFAQGGPVGYANGGPAGYSMGVRYEGKEYLRALQREFDLAKKTLERNTSKLEDLRSEMKSFGDSVAANFKNDPFNQKMDNGVGGLSAFAMILDQDRAGAKQMDGYLKTLRAKGINEALYRELAASGDLQTAQELSVLSKSGINKYDKLFLESRQAATALGRQASQDSYGPREKMWERAVADFTRVTKNLDKRIDGIENAARKGTRQGVKDASDDLVTAIRKGK